MPSGRYICCVKHIKRGSRTSVSCIPSSAGATGVCSGLHFKQQLLGALKARPRSPSSTPRGDSSHRGPLQDRDTDRAATPRQLLPPGSLPTDPKAQTVTANRLSQSCHCHHWYLNPPLLLGVGQCSPIWKLKRGVKDVPPSAFNLVLSYPANEGL